jgi:hypothetical protein
MNNKEDIDQLLARYFAGEPLSLVQQKELDTWIAAHRQEFEQMHKLMQAPVRTAEEIHFDADKAWAKIEPHWHNTNPLLPVHGTDKRHRCPATPITKLPRKDSG